MYLEEDMQEQQMTEDRRFNYLAARIDQISYLATRIDQILNHQQEVWDRLAELEQPLAAFEDGSSLEAMRRNRDQLIDEKRSAEDRLHRALVENEKLSEEVKRLRSRLSMMQAGYNAIAAIQARLDANEQEMGGNRCCTG